MNKGDCADLKGRYTMTRINNAFLKGKLFFAANGLFYALGLAVVFALKYYYSKASSDTLDWILAPTTWWVHFLSGIPFEKVAGSGYVNHDYQFIIAPSCAGLNFMIIALSTLLFCFIHRIRTGKGKFLWMISCIEVVYLFTILVNCLRIIPSIYLLRMNIYSGWVTPERVHTVEGTLVYFASLLLLYAIADEALSHLMKKTSGSSSVISDNAQKSLHYPFIKWLLPVCIYFGVTLGIPILNGAAANNSAKFLEHAVLVALVCLSVIIWLGLFRVLRKPASHNT